MKKIRYLIGIVIALAVTSAIAGDVTQVAGWSMFDGKRDKALENLVLTDVPAIITELNSVNSTFNGSLVSNASGKVYILTLEVKSGGTVTVPSGSISALALSGNELWARISNAVQTQISGAITVSKTGVATLREITTNDLPVAYYDGNLVATNAGGAQVSYKVRNGSIISTN